MKKVYIEKGKKNVTYKLYKRFLLLSIHQSSVYGRKIGWKINIFKFLFFLFFFINTLVHFSTRPCVYLLYTLTYKTDYLFQNKSSVNVFFDTKWVLNHTFYTNAYIKPGNRQQYIISHKRLRLYIIIYIHFFLFHFLFALLCLNHSAILHVW